MYCSCDKGHSSSPYCIVSRYEWGENNSEDDSWRFSPPQASSLSCFPCTFMFLLLHYLQEVRVYLASVLGVLDFGMEQAAVNRAREGLECLV